MQGMALFYATPQYATHPTWLVARTQISTCNQDFVLCLCKHWNIGILDQMKTCCLETC